MKIILSILAAIILIVGCTNKHSGTSTSKSKTSNKSSSKSSSTVAKKTETSGTDSNTQQEVKPAVPPSEPTKDIYHCNAEVALRESTVSYSKVTMKIMKGEPVEVIEKTNDNCWKVKYRGNEGYANPKLLSK